MSTETKPKEEKPKTKTITLLYKGACVLDSGAVGHEYVELPESNGSIIHTDHISPTWPSRVYAKRFQHAQAGTVFTIDCDLEKPSSVFSNTAKFVKLWPNQKLRAELQAASRALEDAKATERENKKQMSRDQVFELLEPIRRAYQRARTQRKKACVLANVLVAITGRKE